MLERTNNRLPPPMANSMSDEELMAQVRSGVGEMLGVLFERYHVPLFNFYLKLTGDRTTAPGSRGIFFNRKPGSKARPPCTSARVAAR